MKLRILLLFMCCCLPMVYAGTTGKISGKVVDATTGESLPGTNVIIAGSNMGAATDLDGRYTILNVPPGHYTLSASMIGYNILKMTNVVVSIDLTTQINFDLKETVLDAGETITIVAERPAVVKDLTATTAIVGAEDMATLPVTEVGEAIELQAGLIKDASGGLHARGGRSGEVSYWVDGIPMTDVYDGGTVVDVNKNMVQELQVVTGAFNAEYGQAMSGIVNIATKDGSNDFGGSFSTYIGDNVSDHTDQFINIDDINPMAIRNAEFSLHGAIIKDKLFYYVNGRAIHFDGWQYGQNRYNPNAYCADIPIGFGRGDSSFVFLFENNYSEPGMTGKEVRVNSDKTHTYIVNTESGQKEITPGDILNNVAPEYYDASKMVGDYYYTYYVVGSNSALDSLIVNDYMYNSYAQDAVADSFASIYNWMRETHADGRGNYGYNAMNWNEKLYGQVKLIYNMTPSIKLSYSGIYDDVDYQDFQKDYLYNPNGSLKRFRTGLTHILKVTHVVNQTTFYDLGLSHFTKEYKHYVYEDMHDSRYVHPDLNLSPAAYSFKTSGMDMANYKRKTTTMLAKWDLTSQVTNQQQVKMGAEYRKHKVFMRDITVRPSDSDLSIDLFDEGPYIDTQILPISSIYHSTYTHQPTEISAYIQDKLEFDRMIVNIGVRMDYFDPDAQILTDPLDPEIYDPLLTQNRFRDYGTDGLPNTNDPDGTEGNGLQDDGEVDVTLEERQAYWYKDATTKFNLSPRLGVSFPITDRGVFHFSYGHFFQIPRFERLYQNPDFDLGEGTGNIGLIGNADLEPEQTVSGEIGVQQQLTDDLTIEVNAYFRDIRNLTGTQADQIELPTGATYSKLVNSDFGLIKGLTFMLSQRFSGGLSGSLDYTLQQAKGSNSDPEQARNAMTAGEEAEILLSPLNWDQRHTVNASINYQAKNWGASAIGQWGSGLPYTPRRSTDISTSLNNSERKPSTYNVDVRGYYEMNFGAMSVTLFARIMNLFDTLNQLNVYDTTGKADFTLDQRVAEGTNPLQLINSLDQWFYEPTYYSEPRRIELGLTVTF